MFWQSTIRLLLKILFVGAITFFCLRGVFSFSGQIGHNWDFTFPAFLSSPENISLPSLYSWNSVNFGYSQHLTLVHIIPNAIYGFLISAFGAILASKFLLFLILAFSILGFEKFSSHVFKTSTTTSILLGLVYTFNPFLLNEIVGGSWYMWVSFAFIPWYCLFTYRYFSGNKRSLFGALFFSILSLASLQNFVIVHAFLFGAMLLVSPNLVYFARRFLIFHLLFLAINLYWITLLFMDMNNFSGQVSSKEFTSSFTQVKENKQGVDNILNLTGYLDRNFYIHTLPPVLKTIHKFATGLVWFFGLIILVTKSAKVSIKIKLSVLLVLLSFMVVKGGNLPFANTTLSFFNSFPLMSLYRSPQHLMIIPAITFALLLGFLASLLEKKYKVFKTATLLTIFVGIFTFGWWVSGDLGHKPLSYQKRDYVDFYSLDPVLAKSLQNAENSNGTHRHLFLPVTQSPLYLATSFQNQAQGGVAEYMFLKTPTFSSESTKEGRLLEEAICSQNLSQFEAYLKDYSVRFITLRADIVPVFTPCTKTWDVELTKKTLQKSKVLKIIYQSDHTAHYEVDTEKTLPIIFIEQNKILTPVDFIKVNPSKYEISLSENMDKATLILNENYNASWVLKDSKGETIEKSTNENGRNSFYLKQVPAGSKFYLVHKGQVVFSYLILLSPLVFLFLFIATKTKK